ncbi:hypothetical protein ACFZCK_00045 [Kitasatospora purpeofusca]|uniref:hypothetical protein n=1 Tax=Kitasatospora purpeofusca TaxID=67352 RepID=UPI0036E3A5C3
MPGRGGIERSLGPAHLPATAVDHVAMWFAIHQATWRLLTEELDEPTLDEARTVFRHD